MRVAVAGLAHSHVGYALDELAHWPDAELVGVAESDPALLAQWSSALGSTLVRPRLPELLAECGPVDAVVVAGVYADRAADVCAALESGAHVVADKPLCTSLDQLDAIERAAEDARRHVSVMFEKRFYPTTVALRQFLAEGVLGPICLVASTGPHKLNASTRPDWFFRRDGYGGIVGDLPVHDIDMVLWLTGAVEGSVAAHAGRGRPPDGSEFADHTAVLLRAGDTLATIEANWLSPEAAPIHGHYRMRVTGTLGTAEVDWAHGTLHVGTHGQDWKAIELPPGRRPAEYFFTALATGTDPEISTGASLLATRVALLGQASADDDGSPRTFAARGDQR